MNKTLEVNKSEDGKIITIMCGDEFIEWDAEQFLKHMKWVDKEKTFEQQLGYLQVDLNIINKQCVDYINENAELKQQLQAEQQAHNEEKEMSKCLSESLILAHDKIIEMDKAYNELREKLKTIEFVFADYPESVSFCPVCDCHGKHSEDCWLNKALKGGVEDE